MVDNCIHTVIHNHQTMVLAILLVHDRINFDCNTASILHIFLHCISIYWFSTYSKYSPIYSIYGSDFISLSSDYYNRIIVFAVIIIIQ